MRLGHNSATSPAFRFMTGRATGGWGGRAGDGRASGRGGCVGGCQRPLAQPASAVPGAAWRAAGRGTAGADAGIASARHLRPRGPARELEAAEGPAAGGSRRRITQHGAAPVCNPPPPPPPPAPGTHPGAARPSVQEYSAAIQGPFSKCSLISPLARRVDLVQLQLKHA
jgi:hypothetical protein